MNQHDKSRSPLDRLLAELGHAIRISFAVAGKSTALIPGDNVPENPLSEDQRTLSEGLMRINHAGEIAAQALYRGQALMASDLKQRKKLLQAAKEEQDHLQWCQQRLHALKGRPSILAPVWYTGSFLVGVAAGLAGDRWSLGFVEETENQVSAHLNDHLQRLPAEDLRSRAVVARMREDETRHAQAAHDAGAKKLPSMVRISMAKIADFMRFTSLRW